MGGGGGSEEEARGVGEAGTSVETLVKGGIGRGESDTKPVSTRIGETGMSAARRAIGLQLGVHSLSTAKEEEGCPESRRDSLTASSDNRCRRPDLRISVAGGSEARREEGKEVVVVVDEASREAGGTTVEVESIPNLTSAKGEGADTGSQTSERRITGVGGGRSSSLASRRRKGSRNGAVGGEDTRVSSFPVDKEYRGTVTNTGGGDVAKEGLGVREGEEGEGEATAARFSPCSIGTEGVVVVVDTKPVLSRDGAEGDSIGISGAGEACTFVLALNEGVTGAASPLAIDVTTSSLGP